MNTIAVALVVFAVAFASAEKCDQKLVGKCMEVFDKIDGKDTIFNDPSSLMNKTPEELQKLFDNSCNAVAEARSCIGEAMIETCLEETANEGFISMIARFMLETAKFVCKNENKQVLVESLPCLRKASDDEKIQEETKKCIEKYDIGAQTGMDDMTRLCKEAVPIYKECVAAPLIKQCGKKLERVVCGLIDEAVVPTIHKVFPNDEMCPVTPVFCSSV